MHGGRDLRRSLAQPPAPSRVKCVITAGCSGLHPVGAWKSQRMVTAKPLWATNLLQSMTVHLVKKIFLIPSLNLSFFSLCLISPNLPPWTTVESLTQKAVAQSSHSYALCMQPHCWFCNVLLGKLSQTCFGRKMYGMFPRLLKISL